MSEVVGNTSGIEKIESNCAASFLDRSGSKDSNKLTADVVSQAGHRFEHPSSQTQDALVNDGQAN